MFSASLFDIYDDFTVQSLQDLPVIRSRSHRMTSLFDRVPLEIFDRILRVQQMKRWPCPDAKWEDSNGEQYEIRRDELQYRLVNKTWHTNLEHILIEPDTLQSLVKNATEIIILRELARLQ